MQVPTLCSTVQLSSCLEEVTVCFYLHPEASLFPDSLFTVYLPLCLLYLVCWLVWYPSALSDLGSIYTCKVIPNAVRLATGLGGIRQCLYDNSQTYYSKERKRAK